MKPSDLARLHASAFEATRAWSTQEFEQLLQTNGVQLCGDHRGFVLTRVTIDEAEILTIATDPPHQRKGLARAMLAQAERTAGAAGATTMFLEVAENNVAAKALYHDCGYLGVGRRPGYYMPKDGAPVAALVLRKKLIAI